MVGNWKQNIQHYKICFTKSMISTELYLQLICLINTINLTFFGMCNYKNQKFYKKN